MGLEQQPKLGELAQILRRNRRDLEAALAFGHHEPLGRQAVQQFAQRADARAIVLAQAVELELLAGRELAENDVGADAPVGLLSNRIVVGRSGQHVCRFACLFRHAATLPGAQDAPSMVIRNRDIIQN